MEESLKDNGEKWTAEDVIYLAKTGNVSLIHQDHFSRDSGFLAIGGRRRFLGGFSGSGHSWRKHVAEVAIFSVLRHFSWVFVGTVQSFNAS